MSEEDQITLNLDDGMSSTAMTQARALYDEIINLNTKIIIMKQNGLRSDETYDISELRRIRKYMKDRIEYYQTGGNP